MWYKTPNTTFSYEITLSLKPSIFFKFVIFFMASLPIQSHAFASVCHRDMGSSSQESKMKMKDNENLKDNESLKDIKDKLESMLAVISYQLGEGILDKDFIPQIFLPLFHDFDSTTGLFSNTDVLRKAAFHKPNEFSDTFFEKFERWFQENIQN